MKVFWKSTIGNTPVKVASAFYFNVKSHVCYKKESVSLLLKNNFPLVIFIVNSYLSKQQIQVSHRNYRARTLCGHQHVHFANILSSVHSLPPWQEETYIHPLYTFFQESAFSHECIDKGQSSLQLIKTGNSKTTLRVLGRI